MSSSMNSLIGLIKRLPTCQAEPCAVLSSRCVPPLAGCSEVEPSSHGLVNACAAFPGEAHAAHRYAWVNNRATCCISGPGLPLVCVSENDICRKLGCREEPSF